MISQIQNPTRTVWDIEVAGEMVPCFVASGIMFDHFRNTPAVWAIGPDGREFYAIKRGRNFVRLVRAA